MVSRVSRHGWLRAAGAASLAALPRPVLSQMAGTPLRIGSNLGDAYAEAYYAREAGYFRRAGLDVDLPIINQGGTMVAAVSSGSLDIAITTTISLANAYLRGLRLTIIAAGAISTPQAPGSPIIVLETSTLREPRDLIGKAVALNGIKALSQVALYSWLSRGGVDPALVHVIEMPFAEMAEAVRRGTVAAALSIEPFLSAALGSGDFRIIADPYQAISRDCLVSAWFTTRTFASAHPGVVKSFASSIYEAARWANAHHAETAAILAKYAKVDINRIATMKRAQYDDAIHVADIQPEIDAAVRFAVLPRPINASDLVFKA